MATFTGTSGNDSLTGTAGDDTLVGLGGNDTLVGLGGNDLLEGGDGGDILNGGDGDDTLDGGAGTDTANYSGASGAVTVNLVLGSVSGAAGNDTLLNIERVRGSAFNDVLTGNDNNNLLRGNKGDDTLDGGGGADTADYSQASGAVTVNLATGKASGADGNDTLVSIEIVRGSAFNDTLIGGDPAHAADSFGDRTGETFQPGAGNDTITGGSDSGLSGIFFAALDYALNTSAQAVTVNLGTGIASDGQGGTDKFSNIDGVRGGAGDDLLIGGGLSRAASGFFFESYRGNAGNDTIDGAGGGTTIARADRVDYVNSPFAVVVNLGTTAISGNYYGAGVITVAGGTARDGFSSSGGGTDTILNIDQVQGSDHDDTLVGSNPLFDAGERFEGQGGNDTIDGGSGRDEASYQNDPAAASVNLALGTAADGWGGTDTLVNIEDARGSSFDDLLIGSNGNNRLAGDAGNDTLDGGGGIDIASYRQVPLANGGINAFIENGAGTINDGYGTVDTLMSIEGLEGTHSNDRLAGGAGDQWFRGRGGSDTLDGGAGSDWVSYFNDPSAVTVNLSTGTAADGWNGANVGLGGTDTLISIENAEGSRFNDVLSGDAGSNELRGGDGDDTLTGAAGDDTLNGGAGADTAVYSGNRDAYTIIASAFGYTVSGAEGNDTLIGIESAKFADATVALDVNFVVDEVITGTPDNDTLVGGDTNDLILGDAGDDLLIGNDGDDVLDGGPGADRMEGGNGNDTYFVDNVKDAVIETSNGETITLANAAGGGLPAVEGLPAGEDLPVGAGLPAITGIAPNALDGSAVGGDLSVGGGLPVGAGLPAITGISPNALDGFTDTVIAAIDYSLATLQFVENLTLNEDGTATLATGNALDNVLAGNALSNTLEGSAGNDTLDGGAGADTAAFSGARSSSTITKTASGYTVSGTDGTDTLTSIERLQFTDQKLAIDLDLGQSGGNTVRIIGAAFDAPAIAAHPDWVGLGLTFFDSGQSIQQVSALVAQLMNLSNADLVTTLYTNVVGAPPDNATRDSFVALLQGSGGTMTQGELLVLASEVSINEQNINLAGLQQGGVEFV